MFTQGCNFRCGYCHNPELVIPERFCPSIPEQEVFDFLRSRQQYLQGVVVSGGEPTIQGGLVAFLDQIKRLGYLIKLDTNGGQPDILRQLVQLKLLNYVAMDVKAPLDRYEEIINAMIDPRKIEQSIEIIIHSGIKHEFRTTVVKSLCSQEDLYKIRQMIKGSQRYNLQKARIDENVLDQRLSGQGQYTDEEFKCFKEELEKCV
ncbi:MAG: anaerobic ribonucleoside-triphosphate reductase activating protein [Candidatus Omnitrophota bacterium]|nr:anaerobic ribonucleoside-triphosphate reductase activating protein [Candidatus Omnitrophota bacterium]